MGLTSIYHVEPAFTTCLPHFVDDALRTLVPAPGWKSTVETGVD